jgi:hypothetical protein
MSKGNLISSDKKEKKAANKPEFNYIVSRVHVKRRHDNQIEDKTKNSEVTTCCNNLLQCKKERDNSQ